MKKQYVYTLYGASGDDDILELSPREKMTLEELQEAVGGYIEILPSEYYKHKGWGRCTVYVDEEGKFKGKPRNNFFKDLGEGFFVVGTALREQVYRG